MNNDNIHNTDYILSIIDTVNRDGSPHIDPSLQDEEFIESLRDILNIYSQTPPNNILRILSVLLRFPLRRTALVHLHRYVQALSSPDDIIRYSDTTTNIIAYLLAASTALSGRIIADPTLIDEIENTESPLEPRLDAGWYRDRMNPEPGDDSVQIRHIHRIHTVELIRICARNTLSDISLVDISKELSLLADTVVDTCLDLAWRQITRNRANTPDTHSLIVLGLGKLGGMELNVSSDIDLIYLCEEPEDRKYEVIELHARLAEKLTRLLSEATPKGYLYRVDTRLRADGQSGPLVRTTVDYLRYLELRGEAWERQMLLKARPVAGKLHIGNDFLTSVKHFIFPRSLTRSPNSEVVALKEQIEARLVAEGSGKTHIKLMPGGIRDIEFTVQCLQLLMGGTHPDVRSSGTLDAIERLHNAEALSTDEYMLLREAYLFYRRLENCLQWQELLPAFSLPSSDLTLAQVGHIMGYIGETPEIGLLDDLSKHQRKVRTLYEEIFTVHEDETFEGMVLYCSRIAESDDRARRFLESQGFIDPLRSQRDLASLSHDPEAKDTDSTTHPSVNRFLPMLVESLVQLPDPGGALERFRRLTEAYHSRIYFFEALTGNKALFNLLLSVCHSSSFLTEMLIGDPSLIGWLFEEGEVTQIYSQGALRHEIQAIAENTTDPSTFSKACLAVKNRERLRTGVRDISGIASTRETFAALTILAETIVTTTTEMVVNDFRRRYQILGKWFDFSVLAAGRLGAHVMNFGSDLDLIFVYTYRRDDMPQEIPHLAVKCAQTILSYISADGSVYRVYEVDARLRPEGGNAVLAVSLDEYRRYLSDRASPWERLALVRTRILTGGLDFRSDIESLLDGFVYRKPFSDEEIIGIMDIRATMIASSVVRNGKTTNIKTGSGGISDIDFVAQTFAAHFGSSDNHLKGHDTHELLEKLSGRKIGKDEAGQLQEMYEFLNDIEKFIRLSSGTSANSLPGEGIELARIARLAGYTNIRRFQKKLTSTMTRVHELYSHLMTELLGSAGDQPTQT